MRRPDCARLHAYPSHVERARGSIRATRLGSGLPATAAPKPGPRAGYAVADPAAPRGVVDHTLAKRQVVQVLRTSLAPDYEHAAHLDPDPYLFRAATHHGETTERPCPWCSKPGLVHVKYAYGDDLGDRAGQARGDAELVAMAMEFGEFDVWLVEVCPGCGWNHVHLTYTLGDGRARR